MAGCRMKTKDFSFDLPESLIAQTPAQRRGEDRLLVLDRNDGSIVDLRMEDFPDLLEADSLLVLNDSKVRKARVYGRSETGSLVEFLFVEERADHSWLAMTSRSKKQRIGKRYTFTSSTNTMWQAHIVGTDDEGLRIVEFDEPIDESFFIVCGHVPLPPYIKREDTFVDEERYQTVYAANSGSVAAPTAGLHFTRSIIDRIRRKHIETVTITLHVGLGTFLPVRSETIEDHKMHFERYTVSPETADAVNAARLSGRPIVAVGTTSVRTLESAYNDALCTLKPGEGRTNLFITPGYRYRVVNQLLTNFHTPESTLLMLVSAFAGYESVMNAYRHAVGENYKFFSYGDAMFIR